MVTPPLPTARTIVTGMPRVAFVARSIPLMLATVATTSMIALTNSDPANAEPTRAKHNDAGVRTDAASSFVVSKDPPDPTPLVANEQWVLALEYRKGDIFLLNVEERASAVSVKTARAFGRFALELWQKDTLVERVRFDFPLLGAGVGTEDAGIDFSKGLTSRIGVLFPMSALGDRLELVDRATRRRFTLPWPPLVSPTSTPAQ
jgi:hypothetical protein